MQQLKDYLYETQKDTESAYDRYDRFGAQLGVTGACVRKWIYRERRIKDHFKLKIEKITRGQVTLRDLVAG